MDAGLVVGGGRPGARPDPAWSLALGFPANIRSWTMKYLEGKHMFGPITNGQNLHSSQNPQTYFKYWKSQETDLHYKGNVDRLILAKNSSLLVQFKHLTTPASQDNCLLLTTVINSILVPGGSAVLF